MQSKTFKKKGKYQGNLTKKGLREGIGIFHFDDTNNIYLGEWENDLFHGNGSYFYESGDIYRGELVKGQKHGKGVYYYKNGNIYDGDWQNDFKHGQGEKFYAGTNEKYQGECCIGYWLVFMELLKYNNRFLNNIGICMN